MGVSGVGPVRKLSEMTSIMPSADKGQLLSSCLLLKQKMSCHAFVQQCMLSELWSHVNAQTTLHLGHPRCCAHQYTLFAYCHSHPTSTITLTVDDITGAVAPLAGQSSAGSALVLIAPISPSESSFIHLMAVTADGRRFYLSSQPTNAPPAPVTKRPVALHNVTSRSAISPPAHQGQSRYPSCIGSAAYTAARQGLASLWNRRRQHCMQATVSLQPAKDGTLHPKPSLPAHGHRQV